MMKLSYRQLQIELRKMREEGLTDIRLNSKKAVLQAEYNRIIAVKLPVCAKIDKQLTNYTLDFKRNRATNQRRRSALFC